MNNEEKTVFLFNKTYIIKKKLNSGSFGEVFLGQNIITRELCALKLEIVKKNDDEIMRTILREASILFKLQHIPGIPRILWSGTEFDYDVLIIELLGQDMASLLKTYKRFSLKTILLLGIKTINLLQSIHEKDIVHRDIKPENILTGYKDKMDQIYLIDYGISKIYRNEEGRHLIYKENKPFIGTMRYASKNSHFGIELSRRDDLESLGYVLLFLKNGTLPWQNLDVSSKEKNSLVGKIKKKISNEELCKDLPKEFSDYFNHVKHLEFKETPNYDYLLKLFYKMAEDKEYKIEDIIFDWIENNTNKSAASLIFEKQSANNSMNKINMNSSHKKVINKQSEEIYNKKSTSIKNEKLTIQSETPQMNKINQMRKSSSKEMVSPYSSSLHKTFEFRSDKKKEQGSNISLTNNYIPSIMNIKEGFEEYKEEEMEEYPRRGKKMIELIQNLEKTKVIM